MHAYNYWQNSCWFIFFRALYSVQSVDLHWAQSMNTSWSGHNGWELGFVQLHADFGHSSVSWNKHLLISEWLQRISWSELIWERSWSKLGELKSVHIWLDGVHILWRLLRQVHLNIIIVLIWNILLFVLFYCFQKTVHPNILLFDLFIMNHFAIIKEPYILMFKFEWGCWRLRAIRLVVVCHLRNNRIKVGKTQTRLCYVSSWSC